MRIETFIRRELKTVDMNINSALFFLDEYGHFRRTKNHMYYSQIA